MFRRGFKSWCESASLQYRAALGLRPHEPLCAERLAVHLGLRVVPICAIPCLSAQAVRQLTLTDPGSWSAVTISVGEARIVVVNPAHSDGRRSNDLMHECAHAALNHVPPQAFRHADGPLMLSAYDKQQEAEADWLAATLLLPRAALLRVIHEGTGLDHAAHQYRTSLALLRMRLDRTGVNIQARRRTG